MDQKLSEITRAPQIGMSVQLNQNCGEVLDEIREDCAVAIVGPGGTLLQIYVDGSVRGDPEAVEREVLAAGADLSGRALLGLARLALRVSRPN